MRAKKTVAFFSVLLLFSMLTFSVDASPDTTASFRGSGVTIDLTYPEEAQPTESVWHNVTITSNTALTLYNFTVVIKAPVNSGWQVVFTDKDETKRYMVENATLPWPIQTDSLAEEADGKLYCFMYVNTSQSTDYAAYTFYTTLVSEPTFSEMRVLYDEMLANYTILQEDYEVLLGEYNGLLANYSGLFANYTALLIEYDALSGQYDDQVSAYQKKIDEYNDLSEKYATLYADNRATDNELGVLQTNYDNLNTTRYELQGNYSSLETIYDELNDVYTNLQTDFANLQDSFNVSQGALDTDRIVMFIFLIAVAVLIAFIVYLKRKKEDPYLVIRKETVSMKTDEET